MKFLVLGCNGMAGHLIAQYLSEQGHEVIGFARQKSKYTDNIVGDAADFDFLGKKIGEGKYDSVINCVGILNRNAEDNHFSAVMLNSCLPHFLAKVTENTDTQVIHLSTDCVFSGTKGGYTETSIPDGTTFYDRTKAMGELDDKKNVTLRNSIIGPDINENGIGLLNWFMKQNQTVNGYVGAIWTGQTTLQLAKTIEIVAKNRCNGLYNMVPDEKINKYELLKLFNKYIRRSPIEIKPVNDFAADKSLIRTRYDGLDYIVPGYEIMIKELGEWIREHRNMYSQYDI